MRNKVFGKQLSRNKKSREALFRSLVREVVLKGKITTTHAKAIAVRPELEKLMQFVKRGDLASKRLAYAMLGNSREVHQTLFTNYETLAKSRPGGFVSIVRLPSRKGDAASISKIEWVAVSDTPSKEEVKEKKSSSRSSKKASDKPQATQTA